MASAPTSRIAAGPGAWIGGDNKLAVVGCWWRGKLVEEGHLFVQLEARSGSLLTKPAGERCVNVNCIPSACFWTVNWGRSRVGYCRSSLGKGGRGSTLDTENELYTVVNSEQPQKLRWESVELGANDEESTVVTILVL